MLSASFARARQYVAEAGRLLEEVYRNIGYVAESLTNDPKPAAQAQREEAEAFLEQVERAMEACARAQEILTDD
jgi:lipopolysaccharide biosynthesis regulator YciM